MLDCSVHVYLSSINSDSSPILLQNKMKGGSSRLGFSSIAFPEWSHFLDFPGYLGNSFLAQVSFCFGSLRSPRTDTAFDPEKYSTNFTLGCSWCLSGLWRSPFSTLYAFVIVVLGSDVAFEGCRCPGACLLTIKSYQYWGFEPQVCSFSLCPYWFMVSDVYLIAIFVHGWAFSSYLHDLCTHTYKCVQVH